ncbi:hypothetical protein J3E72DRAFT_428677 [Bipolaris maydis]|uniref:uncharacterized protein n=1 Tax=Cochliobolus heterostrophus TaxID=5016 RepID=UPI0024D1E675|nr:hypothetical protein J3E73DRAFT_420060 [Bipolaris maydis]KAJ5038516.1 hypothetical protein J3E74DRAFT_423573 [Bipolaris maydis]KAJ5064824.1 hypothetical protein J3E74DRAFT_470419 [Bipolaris maydis]KAJ6200034.1 hypothetical protein J3E72DRAFT_428677 [Bipolaris maydis]KAJ6275337.1 hypothetical protein PSV08DRAFT_399439 [Bipolaris maydis]
MSNYGSNTQPGGYQGAPQNYAQQQQYGQPGHTHKSGGIFGQMMSQAVSTGKPMVDRLGQTLSSKLGNKPAPGPPQHLQSYQNYQSHQNPQGQGHGYQQPQVQTYTPPPQQQQQWQQPQQQQPTLPTTSYTPVQPSPYQPNYYHGASTAAPPSQNNYYPQQSPPPPPPVQVPAAQQPLSAPGYNTSEYGQGQQGQLGQTHAIQSQQYIPHGQQNAYNSQETGFIAGGQTGLQPQSGYPPAPPVPPHPKISPPESTVSPSQQPQWGYAQGHAPHVGQQQQSYSPAPNTPSQQELQHQHQPQPPNLPASNTPYQQEQIQQQQWHPVPPASPVAQVANPISPSMSPPPQHKDVQGQMPPTDLTQTQPSTPAPQRSASPAASTELTAELPADLGSLKLGDSPVGTNAATPSSQYLAHSPPTQATSPSKGFTVPSRKASASSVPLADPWNFVDPVTETPTREFYILADLLYDALDRNFEPRNSGLLEAPKILASWIDLPEDARNLYSYNGYTALAHQFGLEGIPHVMVPVQPHLAPIWNFDQQAHAEELKISEPPSAISSYATYMPALNRAGWYKFFFLEIVQNPDEISTLMPALCADTYKPGVLNHPDLSKRDKSEVQALRSRADEVQTLAIKRVGDEARTAMMLDPNIPVSSMVKSGGSSAASGTLEPGSPEDIAVRMHRIQAERQFNDMAVRTVLGAGITFGPSGGYSGGYASLV